MLSFDLFCSLLTVGVITGGLTGLTGSSGVTIVVPLLTIFMGFSIHQAIGTSLVVDVVASIAISMTYLKHGNVDKSGRWIAIGAVVGAQIGAAAAVHISAPSLAIWFGISTIGTGLYMWSQNGKEMGLGKYLSFYNRDKPWMVIVSSIVVGGFLGGFAGLTGAGGGLGIFMALILLLNMPVHKAIGTSTLVMAITALSGSLGFYFHGELNMLWGIVIGIGSILGGVFSAKAANKISETALTRITASLFIGIGIAITILEYTGDFNFHI